MYTRNGRSTSVMTGLGCRDVSGRRRVPSPPTRMTACMALMAPADALVDEPGRADGVGVERVAAVDEQVAVHLLRDRGEVQRLELVPLGDEHDRVGAVDDLERVGRELDAGDQLAGLLL